MDSVEIKIGNKVIRLGTDVTFAQLAQALYENSDLDEEEIAQKLQGLGADEDTAWDAVAQIDQDVTPDWDSMPGEQPNQLGDERQGPPGSDITGPQTPGGGSGGMTGDIPADMPGLGPTDLNEETADPNAAMGMDDEMDADPADYALDMADDYVNTTPNATGEQVVQYLLGMGVPEDVANQTAAELFGGGGQAMASYEPKTEDQVTGPFGSGVVEATWNDLYYDYARVAYMDGDKVRHWEGRTASLKPLKQEEGLNLLDKLARHFSTAEHWYEKLTTGSAPSKYKEAYQTRLGKVTALRQEALESIRKAKSTDEAALLDKYIIALGNEAKFCEDAMNTTFSKAEQAYIDAEPTYNVRAAHQTLGFGPGGGDTIVQAAEELAQEQAKTDWGHEVVAGAELFVEGQHSFLLSDAQELARVARRYIRERVGHLEPEAQQQLTDKFVGNVERARRAAYKELVKNTEPKTAKADLPDNATDEGLFL